MQIIWKILVTKVSNLIEKVFFGKKCLKILELLQDGRNWDENLFFASF